jgi:hypothetical protein
VAQPLSWHKYRHGEVAVASLQHGAFNAPFDAYEVGSGK